MKNTVCECGKVEGAHVRIPAGEGHHDLKCPGLDDRWFKVAWRCAKHTRYEGKGRPRLPCEQCWRLYIEKHP